MIHLAKDPTESRAGFWPARSDAEGKSSRTDAKLGRSGHAWPFISRYADRPTRQDSQKPAGRESGS